MENLEMIVISIMVVAIAVGALSFVYYNKKHAPSCSRISGENASESEYCNTCGAEFEEDCKKN